MKILIYYIISDMKKLQIINSVIYTIMTYGILDYLAILYVYYNIFTNVLYDI